MVDREKARAESAEGRLAEALETSDEGVMLVSPDNRVIVVNSRLRAYFPDAVSSLVPGASYLALAGRLSGLLAKRSDEQARDAARFEAGEHQLPDGRWIRISISPTSDHGKIVFVSDFTQIKQREESYKQAKHEAEAASAAKSRFLANMSHELRTPLNAIIGFSEIISAQMFGSAGSPRYVDYANDILHSGRHLLDVINSVLDLSKSEAGKLNLRPEDVDLRDVLSDCVKMVSEQCAEAGLALNVSGLDAALPVRGEKAKLRQIFLNLMSNAIKFTEKGGVISLDVKRGNHDIAVSVSDTGIGMSPSDVQIALTPFGQVDNRLERKYDGTGLGLPLTKTFVELHGGTLQIESTVGRGTTVTVRLMALAHAEAQFASA
jgi:signal transduction histidine kinase